MTTDYDVPYMRRTRDYYRAQGYTNDYRWAANSDSVFTQLGKPLSRSRIAAITTAMPDTEQGRRQRGVYSSSSKPIPASMYTKELSWHQSMTHTDDVGSFLPLAALSALSDEGVVGSVSSQFYSAPTEYSQRNTLHNDAPEIIKLCQRDEVDVAILVPL